MLTSMQTYPTLAGRQAEEANSTMPPSRAELNFDKVSQPNISVQQKGSLIIRFSIYQVSY